MANSANNTSYDGDQTGLEGQESRDSQQTDVANDDSLQQAADSAVSGDKGASKATDILNYYLLPLGVFVVSLLLVIFVLLPQVGDVLTKLSEISTYTEDYNKLLENRQRRISLSTVTNDQKSVLGQINKLIPQSQTAVVDFSESVRTLATGNRLQVLESVAGEVVTVNTNITDDISSNTDTKIELVELPAKFTMRGRFENVRKFLSDLYESGDFIIVKEMELRQVTQADTSASSQQGSNVNRSSLFQTTLPENNWTIEVTLTKYQFRVSGETDADSLRSVYFNIPDGVRPATEVVDFIKRNYPSS